MTQPIRPIRPIRPTSSAVPVRLAARCALAICVLAGVARADLRVTFRNDALSDLDPPLDDSGFTNATEVGGPRRWDQVELVATVERPWGPWLTVGARLGPTVGGNWGGRWLQNAYHAVTHTGPTLDEGLQDTYPQGRTIGAVAGGQLRAQLGDRLRGFARLDGQLAVAAGLSKLEAAIGGEAIHRRGEVELGIHAELAVARYHAGDPPLELPGGYATADFEPAFRIGAHVAWHRVRFDYEYRANEGGSGEPVGLLGVTIKQAGEAF